MSARRWCSRVGATVAILAAPAGVAAESLSTAFFYGPSVPDELARAYDQLVVDPVHVPDPTAVARLGATPVAYLSVGEVGPGAQAGLDPGWIRGRNAGWSSLVMDLAHPGYQAYLQQRLSALHRAGYRRFFLDTLDSYLLAADAADTAEGGAARESQRRALVALVRGFAARHPEVRFLLNRGFEILDEVAACVHGVVAESLFERWNPTRKRYEAVSAADRAWLTAQLRAAQERHHLPVVVIDYVAPRDRAKARATAQAIAVLGFEPWVCSHDLGTIGIGRYEIMPRRVLVLWQSGRSPHDASSLAAQLPEVARALAPILEWLGYVPQLWDLAQGLPASPLVGRVAGVVTCLEASAAPERYASWLLRETEQGVRVAVFGALGFEVTSREARALGFVPAAEQAPGQMRVIGADHLIGFEAPPARHPIEGRGFVVRGPSVASHLALADLYGDPADAIVTTAWGGVASSHVFALRGLSGERAWVVDPFRFVTRALDLPELPAPDVTSEDGRRVALFVIEADGLAEHARLRGRPRTATVLRNEILARYGWPHALPTRAREWSARDRRAVRELLQHPAAYATPPVLPSWSQRPHIEPSLTELGGSVADYTGVPVGGASSLIALPAAPAEAYLRGASEAYPYRTLLRALAATESPRRLTPLVLLYPAWLVASPGGLSSLRAIYDWIAQRPIAPISLDRYTARLAAFREQVLARELDGSYRLFGGEALRTVRVSDTLGPVDRDRSESIASVTSVGTTTYVTFSAGTRRLALRARADHARRHVDER